MARRLVREMRRGAEQRHRDCLRQTDCVLTFVSGGDHRMTLLKQPDV